MKKVGLKDIAGRVGVSTALVSYVLNGQAEIKKVSKASAEKIKKAAEELNYRPNQIAKSLKMDKTFTIGLIVADINYRFSVGITHAIEAEAKKVNYTVLLANSNEDDQTFAELVNVLINRQVDGLILAPTENSQHQIRLLQESGIPFVLIDRYFPDIPTTNIVLDNYKSGYDGTAYLISNGFKRIAFFTYKTTFFHLWERYRGYIDALRDNGINFKPNWLNEIYIDPKWPIESLVPNRFGGVDYYMEKMLKEEPFDAIFFATDTLAIDGIRSLKYRGVQMPQQVAVLSFDESEAFWLFHCRVSHMRQPVEAMGRAAVNTLLELISKNKVVEQPGFQSNSVVGESCMEY
jgi:LacI family transcriptional regulator